LADTETTDVASLNFPQRLGAVYLRAAGKFPAEVGNQILGLVSPASLALTAATIIAWIASHFAGIGEIIDVIIGAVGWVCVGMAVFSGLDELFAFGSGAYYAQTDSDLDAAAEHLAKAVAILDITAVLALLLRGRPQGGRRPVRSDPEPPPSPGWFYKPSTVGDPRMTAGEGSTTAWGDIRYSIAGPASEARKALIHEKVHQFFVPKLQILRNFRIENRNGSYYGSSLYRYINEALAETIAQVGVDGFSGLYQGIAFPVKYNYVFLLHRGGIIAPGGLPVVFGGKALLLEGATLLGAGTSVGFDYELWFKQDATIEEVNRLFRASSNASAKTSMAKTSKSLAYGLRR
jgi:hypothetical protein